MTGLCGCLCTCTEINTKTEGTLTFFSLRITVEEFVANIPALPSSTLHTKQLRHVYGSESDTSIN